MDSPWCSFIPEELLFVLANDNNPNVNLRKSAQETINTGNSLFENFKASKIIDNGDDLLSRLENNERVGIGERPSLLDTSVSRLSGDLLRLIYNADSQEIVSVQPGREQVLDSRTKKGRTTILANVDKVRCFFNGHFDYKLYSRGRTMVAVTTNYGHEYMNAHWTGKRVILGSGNPAFLNGFDTTLDVIAHEITHGVILRTSGLENFGKPGALSEHLADVFGLLCKHYKIAPAQNAADCIWTIGEDLWGLPLDNPVIDIEQLCSEGPWLSDSRGHDPSKSVNTTPEQALTFKKQALTFKKLPRYLRSFSDPTSTMPAQPIHIDEYSELKTDNGGVHHNSGIGNYAFYNAAVDAGGPPLNGVGQIWFRAMIDETLGVKCDFPRFAAFTVAYAARDFSHLVDSVKKGWDIVGVTPDEVLSVYPRVIIRVRETAKRQ